MLSRSVVDLLVNIGMSFIAKSLVRFVQKDKLLIELNLRSYCYSEQLRELCESFEHVHMQLNGCHPPRYTQDSLHSAFASLCASGGARSMQLHDWPSLQDNPLPVQTNITSLSLASTARVTFSQLQTCLEAVRTTLVTLRMAYVTITSVDVGEFAPLNLPTLQKVVISHTPLSSLDCLVRLLSGPRLASVQFLECLRSDTLVYDLSEDLSAIRSRLPLHGVQATFFSTFTCSLSSNWTGFCSRLSKIRQALLEEGFDSRYSLCFNPYEVNNDYRQSFPKAVRRPVDDCTLDEIIPLNIRGSLSSLSFRLADKAFKPTRSQQEVSLPILTSLELAIHVDTQQSMHAIAKLSYLLNGLDLPALSKFVLEIKGQPLPSTVEKQMHHIALFLPMCPSLDIVYIKVSKYYQNASCFDYLKMSALEAGLICKIDLIS